MKLNEKLRSLRTACGRTQEEIADALGVSAQSVSKWERGILSPDIHLLPKIAVLYGTSIDALFDMEFYWGEQHKADFRARIRSLLSSGDHEGIYRAYITEIERVPDDFSYYPEVMLCVLRAKLFDTEHIARLIRLSDYADNHCDDDDIRNETHRLMLQICSFSQDIAQRARAKKYYMQLSMLRHSREIYAQYVMDGAEYREQLQKNIMRCIDIAECAVRQMITHEMSAEEKIRYYRVAAALYETVLGGHYGGFFDIPLLSDLYALAKLYTETGETAAAEDCMKRLLSMTEAMADPGKRPAPSDFVYNTHPANYTAPEKNAVKLLACIVADPMFAEYRERSFDIMGRLKGEKTDN